LEVRYLSSGNYHSSSGRPSKGRCSIRASRKASYRDRTNKNVMFLSKCFARQKGSSAFLQVTFRRPSEVVTFAPVQHASRNFGSRLT